MSKKTEKIALRHFSCPVWYCQFFGFRRPEWKECVTAGTAFYNCPFFKRREECWNKFDKEVSPQR